MHAWIPTLTLLNRIVATINSKGRRAEVCQNSFFFLPSPFFAATNARRNSERKRAEKGNFACIILMFNHFVKFILHFFFATTFVVGENITHTPWRVLVAAQTVCCWLELLFVCSFISFDIYYRSVLPGHMVYNGYSASRYVSGIVFISWQVICIYLFDSSAHPRKTRTYLHRIHTEFISRDLIFDMELSVVVLFIFWQDLTGNTQHHVEHSFGTLVQASENVLKIN